MPAPLGAAENDFLSRLTALERYARPTLLSN
jgi:hypothetical protein